MPNIQLTRFLVIESKMICFSYFYLKQKTNFQNWSFYFQWNMFPFHLLFQILNYFFPVLVQLSMPQNVNNFDAGRPIGFAAFFGIHFSVKLQMFVQPKIKTLCHWIVNSVFLSPSSLFVETQKCSERWNVWTLLKAVVRFSFVFSSQFSFVVVVAANSFDTSNSANKQFYIPSVQWGCVVVMFQTLPICF